MDITHRLAFNGELYTQFITLLERLDIPYNVSPLPNAKIGMVYFDICESHPEWNEIETLSMQIGASNISNTLFTTEEVRQAAWCRLIPTFQRGYPEPQGSWVDNPINYDGFCHECGVYEKQIKPFRIKKEPNLGKHAFMSLHWTYSLFALPQIFTHLEQNSIQGFESWDVTIHRTDEASKTIAQIYMLHKATACFLPDDTHERNICGSCGTIKYLPHRRGYMQYEHSLLNSSYDFLLSREWFGDGHMAYREILASRKIALLILENGWKGLDLKPVEIE